MPHIIPMQGSLPGFQHTCAMHVSPGRQHNCISLEVQQCIKPTSSLCQLGWLSVWLTQDLSSHPRKWQTPSDFKSARLEMQQKALQFIRIYSGCYFAGYEEIILMNSLILEWILLNSIYIDSHIRYRSPNSLKKHYQVIPSVARNMNIWHTQSNSFQNSLNTQTIGNASPTHRHTQLTVTVTFWGHPLLWYVLLSEAFKNEVQIAYTSYDQSEVFKDRRWARGCCCNNPIHNSILFFF